MSFHPLLSDWLVYAIALLTLVTAVFQGRKKHVQELWRLLCQSRPAMFSLVMLLIFAGIALIDSVHFKTDNFVAKNGEPALQSLLDKMAPRLAFSNELTYSSPLSNTLSSSTHYTTKTGDKSYGKAPLQQIYINGEHQKNVLNTVFIGFIYGLSLFLLLLILVVVARALAFRTSLPSTLKKYHPKKTPTKWITIAITVGCVLIIGSICIICASRFHLFGTNKIGQDVFFESIKSIRTGVLIGTLSTLFMLPIALILGLLAGYFRGWVDDVIQYLYTTLSSIPGVLLISATVLVMQLYIHNHPGAFSSLAQRADARLVALCVILGITSWANLCRLLRAETLKVKSYDFVQVAKVIKIPKILIIVRHILPNVFHIVLITIALDFSSLVLTESVLSYIGVGVDPTTASWGNIINTARLEMARAPAIWWTLAAAMIVMFLLVLSANLFADALRDALDPRGRFIATTDNESEVNA